MRWRVPFAWLLYPALVAATFAVVRGFDLGWPAVAPLAAPSILTGALVRRPWMYLVPVVLLVAFALVGLSAGWFQCAPDVSCEDAPSTLAMIIVVLGGAICLGGLALGDVLGRGAALLRAAASPGS